MSSPPKLSLDAPRNRRHSFGTFEDPNASQQRPLLRGTNQSPQSSSPSPSETPDDILAKKAGRRRFWVFLLGAGGGLLLVAALTTTLVLLLRSNDSGSPSPKRNVILMVSDGFGPASETYSRSYHQMMNSLPWAHQMPLDTILVGSSRTRSSDSLVTDSAAGATAFSCAMKSYNAAIAVDDNKKPCGTVLEAAKASGMLTGLVATSRITHATPASFSAHVTHRDMENEIAQQQIGANPLGRQLDVMMGGGRCHFMQQSTSGSCRADERDLLTEGQQKGWNFITSRKEFDELDYQNPSFPLGALFTLDHMSYEMDRKPEVEPSLKEMATAALTMLDSAAKSSDKGFFMMIEGSRIDMAAHSKDASAHVHDILAYQDTIAYVKEYVDNHPGTIMISVSDHETGGLTLARQVTDHYPEYRWKPEVVSRVKKSCEALTNQILEYIKAPSFDNSPDALSKLDTFLRETIIKEGLGVMDVTDAEVDSVKKFVDIEVKRLKTPDDPALVAVQYVAREDMESSLAELVNFRAELGWTTHGHSGVDVNLYAYGAESDKLRGNHENTDIGGFIRDYLSLDLKAITKRLNEPDFVTRMTLKEEVIAHKEILNDGLKHIHRFRARSFDPNEEL